MEKATLAGGCFWCTEALFKRLKGVTSVTSGYAGGTLENPTYEQVCNGKTGHAEAIQITFDPHTIPYEKLLEIFFATHNPTTLNQQGNDIGPQYRSAIFYHSEEQKRVAEKLKKKEYATEIMPFTNFYKAEPHHQNYFDRNTDYPYCQYVITPKIQKLFKEFGKEVKEEYKDQ